MRLDYETWIECTVPADRVRRCRAAEAKRARKAAKRRRDAERTVAGRRAAREDMRVRAIGAGSPWRLSAILAHPMWADMKWCLHVYRRWLRRDHERRRADTRRDVRGEVVS